jgi:hypothetical protein
MSDINDFKDLRIWQKGMDIAEKCYLDGWDYVRKKRQKRLLLYYKRKVE